MGQRLAQQLRAGERPAEQRLDPASWIILAWIILAWIILAWIILAWIIGRLHG